MITDKNFRRQRANPPEASRNTDQPLGPFDLPGRHTVRAPALNAGRLDLIPDCVAVLAIQVGLAASLAPSISCEGR